MVEQRKRQSYRLTTRWTPRQANTRCTTRSVRSIRSKRWTAGRSTWVTTRLPRQSNFWLKARLKAKPETNVFDDIYYYQKKDHPNNRRRKQMKKPKYHDHRSWEKAQKKIRMHSRVLLNTAIKRELHRDFLMPSHSGVGSKTWWDCRPMKLKVFH